MFAGLIFATEEADDRPQLAATLPFGGLTLVEFQARLLAAVGVSQIVLVVGRMTPELLGATNRIARRGTAVDVVRSAGEALDKLHPLARVVALADGVVTSGETLRTTMATPGEALLVTEDMTVGYERIGAFTAWAGIAVVDRSRLDEVAAMPRDYDFLSSLVRAAAQAGAEQVRLSAEAAASHRIERDAAALAAMGDAVVAASIPAPVRWADRLVLRQPARFGLMPLIQREVAAGTVAGAGGAVALVGLVLAATGWSFVGSFAVLVGVVGLAIGEALAWLRDDGSIAAGCRVGIVVVIAAAVLLVARSTSTLAGTGTALAVAVAGIAAAALVERLADAASSRWWWSSPSAALLLLLPFLLVGWALAGFVAVAGYTLATLVAAVEDVRQKP